MFSSPQNVFGFTNLSRLVLEIFRFFENHAQNLNTLQNNSASWDLQMGFNSAFKGLMKCLTLDGLSLLMHVIVTLFYLHSLYCTFYKCMNANAFILHQSFLKILAYQMLSVMLVFWGSVFIEILANAHCRKWCDVLYAYYSVKCIFLTVCSGFHYELYS